jgi:hypothetical protein
MQFVYCLMSAYAVRGTCAVCALKWWPQFSKRQHRHESYRPPRAGRHSWNAVAVLSRTKAYSAQNPRQVPAPEPHRGLLKLFPPSALICRSLAHIKSYCNCYSPLCLLSCQHTWTDMASQWATQAQQCIDGKCKPPGALGALEVWAVR